jgi:hypothetical protein
MGDFGRPFRSNPGPAAIAHGANMPLVRIDLAEGKSEDCDFSGG